MKISRCAYDDASGQRKIAKEEERCALIQITNPTSEKMLTHPYVMKIEPFH